jgi:hypothetical protein
MELIDLTEHRSRDSCLMAVNRFREFFMVADQLKIRTFLALRN